MLEQLRYLCVDAQRVVNGRWWRFLGLPFSRAFLIIALYRLERGCWLALGPAWGGLRVLLSPLLALVRPWAGSELHYRADIGPGLMILHPSLGVVVSGLAIVGRDFILTGGNVIGTRPEAQLAGSVRIGNSVNMGANAVVLGPATLGDRVIVGANAVVLRDVAPGATVVGAPARPVR